MSTKPFTLNPNMHLHVVGIGGAGMSAIARVLLGQGFVVSGSDRQANQFTAVLQSQGATIYQGHAASNIAGAEALIISSAIPATNPEVAAASAQGLPILKRSDFLGHLMADRIGIAVAGSHGKTTTTGMVTQVLLEAEFDPTIIVGGALPSLGGNGRSGGGAYFVIEADEYDRMFLGLRPEISIITNIGYDHPDIYPTEASYLNAFRDFAKLLPEDGRLILCGEDKGVQKLHRMLRQTSFETTTYGVQESDQRNAPRYDFQALDCRPNQLGGTDFLVEQDNQILGLARLRVPGLHNVRNALAAIVVGLDLGVDFMTISKALMAFGGVGRRFQIKGQANQITIIDDYAVHPTEIQVTLGTAKQQFPGQRLWAVWQPHTYSRTKQLLTEFSQSFKTADRVVALDIYASREKETLGVDTSMVVNQMGHAHAVHIPQRQAAANYLAERVRPDDVVVTLGAGDGNMVGQWLLEKLQER
ncbi:MAG: UDP-N-acetylmuramate--L-alanine ligase [Chloroflexota bacterium]